MIVVLILTGFLLIVGLLALARLALGWFTSWVQTENQLLQYRLQYGDLEDHQVGTYLGDGVFRLNLSMPDDAEFIRRHSHQPHESEWETEYIQWSDELPVDCDLSNLLEFQQWLRSHGFWGMATFEFTIPDDAPDYDQRRERSAFERFIEDEIDLDGL